MHPKTDDLRHAMSDARSDVQMRYRAHHDLAFERQSTLARETAIARSAELGPRSTPAAKS